MTSLFSTLVNFLERKFAGLVAAPVPAVLSPQVVRMGWPPLSVMPSHRRPRTDATPWRPQGRRNVWER
jgi:hypothetical protein